MALRSLLGNITNGKWTVLIVVGFALFMDYLIYGLVVPLTPNSPARISDESHLGMLYGGYAAGVLLATPFFGWLGDKLGCRKPMIIGVILAAIATVIFGFGSNFYLMFVARVLQGAAAAATWTAGLALVAEHYSEKRVEMMGYAMLGSTGGSVIGPTLGGWLFEVGGYTFPFIVTGVMVAIDACMRIFLLPPEKAPVEASPDLRALLLDKGILIAGGAVMLAAAGWAILEPLLPNHLTKTLGTNPAMIGIMFTVSTIAYGCVLPLVGKAADKFGIKYTICGGMAMMALTLPLLAIPGSEVAIAGHEFPLWAIFALCLVSMSYAFVLNPASAELGNAVDRKGMDCYAAAYAVYNITYSIGMMGSDTFAAVLSEHFTFIQSLLCISGLFALGIPILIWKGGGEIPQAVAIETGATEAPTGVNEEETRDRSEEEIR
jgi:MFS transporter, DHA1 family, solute carrier family 18 (vesicular amine transporter), member 1/2